MRAYEYTATASIVSVDTLTKSSLNVDKSIFLMKSNTFDKNLGSMNLGIVDLYGILAITVEGDTYTSNGEALEEIILNGDY